MHDFRFLKILLSLLFWLAAFSFPVRMSCQMIQFSDDSPIHEAFITRISTDFAKKAIEKTPPSPVHESTPKQLDMQSEWIRGYWAFDRQKDAFVWVSGVWRRPPPNHRWIEGFWKEYPQGWVWISGFWSRNSLENCNFISQEPPDPIDQITTLPPSQDSFWAPGYWHFLLDTREYKWVSGHFEEFDPDWVFIPSHYVFRPGGYVFVTEYWDWKIEDRGTCYAAVLFNSEYQGRASYEPSKILSAEVIVQKLFAHYPDYLTFFHHYWYHHLEFWKSFAKTPPWWKWDTWWCFTVADHWALWWWYTHPGYSQPEWMTHVLSSILPPPLSELIEALRSAEPPSFVTKKGVVKEKQLLRAIRNVTHQFLPILPSSKDAWKKIYTIVEKKLTQPKEILYPTGRHLPFHPGAFRPNVRKPVVDGEGEYLHLVLEERKKPPFPLKPKIPFHRREIWTKEKESLETPRLASQVRQPLWTPKSNDQEQTSKKNQGSQQEADNQELKNWRPMQPYKQAKLSRPPVKTRKNKSVS